MKNVIFTMLCVVGLLVQGCTTINPYTQEKQTSKAGKGAAVGAAIGALAGILSGDGSRERKERALKGAGIGAITGTSVGYYMDVQEAKLRQKLARTGVSVTRDGDRIVLNMPGNITFAVNKWVVKTQFIDVLDSVAEVLKEYKSTMIQVAGHTDSQGSEDANRKLSELRARAVSDELVRAGVQLVRIEALGFGESYPIASNKTADGRQRNRRVELTLVPLVN